MWVSAHDKPSIAGANAKIMRAILCAILALTHCDHGP